MRPEVDELLWLSGDEDGDVSVQCRDCDTGGAAVVFYSTHGPNPYNDDGVPLARTIGELDRFMNQHVVGVHGAPEPRPITVRLVGA